MALSVRDSSLREERHALRRSMSGAGAASGDPKHRPDRRHRIGCRDRPREDISHSGRSLAAWIGLVPNQHSTGASLRRRLNLIGYVGRTFAGKPPSRCAEIGGENQARHHEKRKKEPAHFRTPSGLRAHFACFRRFGKWLLVSLGSITRAERRLLQLPDCA
jgi:hypothetical protein